MNMKKVLDVSTSMCFSPLSEYEFQNLKDDKDIKAALNCGNIYLICRRPRLFFKEVSIKDGELSVKIFQNHTNKEFLFDVNLFQKHIWDGKGTCVVELGQYAFPSSSVSWFDVQTRDANQNSSSQMYDGIKVYKINSKKEKSFVVWFNPEKLIHLCLLTTIVAKISGEFQDLFSLVNYDVLYVGRTNNMHHRQTNHEHVQEILSRERSCWGDLPAHEICLVSLVVADAYEVVPLGSEVQEPVYANEDYYYDLEKALVRTLKPFYNRDKFLNYPSQDKRCLLRSKLIYDAIFYDFNIPIVFNCGSKHIRGYNDHIRVSSDGSVTIVDYPLFCKLPHNCQLPIFRTGLKYTKSPSPCRPIFQGLSQPFFRTGLSIKPPGSRQSKVFRTSCGLVIHPLLGFPLRNWSLALTIIALFSSFAIGAIFSLIIASFGG